MLKYVNFSRQRRHQHVKLKNIIRIDNPNNYRLHFAKKSDGTEPLDDYMDSFEHWTSWQKWGTKNRFPVDYVISFMNFYPKQGSSLFGGIFEVLSRHPENDPSEFYEVRLVEDYKELIGRLIVQTPYTGQAIVVTLNNCYDTIEVLELLPAPYAHIVFPGYENINYDSAFIKKIIASEAPDWKAALSSVKGVYMLTDMNNGKRYIGSAYGDGGIWGRWQSYAYSVHGGNTELIKLYYEYGEEYMQKFKFTLLEVYSASTLDEYIIQRENYWKGVMLSRDERYGYNDN